MSRKIVITKLFGIETEDILGSAEFINPNNIGQLLASGRFTFAPTFQVNTFQVNTLSGSQDLIGLSLIPIEMAVNTHVSIKSIRCIHCKDYIQQDGNGRWFAIRKTVPYICWGPQPDIDHKPDI